ncbi:hypothetical protein CLAFUW4_05967 [Fulvia fulva]|uniref:Uncharacterized protein n=1 Tax=Passalora fulva TaxID=5499 RepID=A0A9Q8LHD7_PASFU|nr:uncharacterized protein CLAFUR5_06111 [Fulvia fulva]KAK4624549.1 hypothetical protein CLAFUR4_05972 [Fulvia fulva]KAK4625906.1 hypothetical protein CLAFUR0_05974 [Fulvia fulva]UJO17494.1 hypothetical protein CLAFUR5_06111 [Fulvia fulva]WPV15055.1 hypothetical protein CLAFUW4_05967 [Fulvia fulva]WPV30166.1 hypothetical protein CLAFUW7_05965 [Fulvia fulva]
MNFSKLPQPRPCGNTSSAQPRLHWNQKAYYKREDFLPLPLIAAQNNNHHIPDHSVCQGARVLFACGHVVNELLPCNEPKMRGKPCPLLRSYPPRHRNDDCLSCTTKQSNMLQVSDLLKPRQLYLRSECADKYRQAGGTDVWRPKKNRFDPESNGERKSAMKEEQRTGVKDAWKVKPVEPLFTEVKLKAAGGKNRR